MRYACFGDVHGNLEALEAVLAVLAGEGIDRYLCTGDLVGYGPDPAACVQRIRELGATVVAGNHDLAVVGKRDVLRFGRLARYSLIQTSRVLSREQKRYLAGLPMVENIDGKITLCHAAVHDLESFPYLKTPEQAAASLQALSTQIGLVGHTHIRHGWVEQDDSAALLTSEQIVLQPGCRYLVNPGSAGQPRDQDPRAAFAIYDEQTCEFEFRRVEYDIDKCSAKFNSDDPFAEWFAERLRRGI